MAEVKVSELPLEELPSLSHMLHVVKGGTSTKISIDQISNMIISLITDGAPETLDTLNEIAAALSDDEDFAGTVVTALAGKQPLAAILSALAGLTGANGSIPMFTGADSFATMPLIGTCSQVGGVPTGAMFEMGSNSNGYYLRTANGFQICWYAYRSDTVLWTFPAAFSVAPSVTATANATGARLMIASGVTATKTNISSYTVAGSLVNDVNNDVQAIGKWF